MKKANGYKPRASAARVQEWVNEEIAKARNEGLKLGLGIDATESLAALVLEAANARQLIEKLAAYVEKLDNDEACALTADAIAFLSAPPEALRLRRPAEAATEHSTPALDGGAGDIARGEAHSVFAVDGATAGHGC